MVVDLLSDRNREEGLATQLERMRINTEKMEWKNRLLDSDDDSDPEDCGPAKDPLGVLVEGMVPPSKELERRAVEHTDKVDVIKTVKKFVPFESVKKSCLDEELRGRLGDVPNKTAGLSNTTGRPSTQSIPLPPTYLCKTQQLSLADSLKLQQEQDLKQRSAAVKQAQERLTSTKGVFGNMTKIEDLKKVGKGEFREYRELLEEVEEESECEEGDSEGEEGVGVVGFQQLAED